MGSTRHLLVVMELANNKKKKSLLLRIISEVIWVPSTYRMMQFQHGMARAAVQLV